jgi:hypothetical protein
MRVQLTAIEKLNVEHPGLQLDVDTLLNQGAMLEDVQAVLREKYYAKVSHQTISKYKQKRWIPSVQRIQDRVERTQAVIRVIKKEGDSDFARAYIFEQLEKAASRGDRIEPAVLLREQRLRVELQLRFRHLEQSNRKLELAIQASAEKLEGATREAAKQTPASSSDRIEALNQIRDVYGLSPLDLVTREPVRPFDRGAVLRKINEVIGVGQRMEERVEPK